VSRKLLIGLLLAIGIAVVFSRVYIHYQTTFTPYGTWYFEVDSYYHVRLIDYMWAHFPAYLKWDMYAGYPDGAQVGFAPFMAFLTVGIAKLSTFGHASLSFTHVVAAWIPPILAGLLTIPLYLLGVTVFNSKFVGIFGSFLALILPTELFHRSIIGFTDHHILEVTFTVWTILLLILSIKKGGYKFAILAGIALGCLHLSWPGSPLLVAILFVWYYLQVMIYTLRKQIVPRIVYTSFITMLLFSYIIVFGYIPYSLNPQQLSITLFGTTLASTFLPVMGKYILKFTVKRQEIAR
jgi:dolichyl-diphosphooligosaccharide--protein glycosyltransferase